ncbi:peptidase G2 autoproteolytic cleavage domain-containing protein, partial [Bacillus sp. SS-TM]
PKLSVLNTEWDPTRKYVARKDRAEWLPVGLIGQMLVRDDGTCEAHGFCLPNDNGIATKAESGFFVIKRTGENQILSFFCSAEAPHNMATCKMSC